MDISLFKSFAIKETRRLELRAEAFNAFNRTDFSNPNTGITNPNFGRLTGTDGGSRILQMALKFAF